MSILNNTGRLITLLGKDKFDGRREPFMIHCDMARFTYKRRTAWLWFMGDLVVKAPNDLLHLLGMEMGEAYEVMTTQKGWTCQYINKAVWPVTRKTADI